jgi:hypothetical protein
VQAAFVFQPFLESDRDLILMERNGLIRVWHDRSIKPGEKWEPRILQELNEADIIVCQLSRDFLASDFCTLTELATASQRKNAGEAELVAYVLKDCGWKEVAELKEFQILPGEAKPMAAWRSRDSYWRAIADGIQQVIESLRDARKNKSAAKVSLGGAPD